MKIELNRTEVGILIGAVSQYINFLDRMARENNGSAVGRCALEEKVTAEKLKVDLQEKLEEMKRRQES